MFYGLPGVSGVGISFGIDRIYDVMDSLGLFGQLPPTATKALFCHLDEASRSYSYQMASELRSRGYAVEVFPDIKKLPKQFEYAEKKGISLVFITGENEMKSGQISYKDLNSKATGTCDKINLSSMLNS